MNVKTRTKKQMSSLTKRSLQRFAQNKLAVAGAIGLILIVLACACAPLLTHYDPGFIDPANRSLAPSKEHLLGTDRVGRDIFARILYGGRWSLFIGFAAAVGANLLGAALGAVSGFYGGKVDRILVAIQEFFQIFPQLLLVVLFVGFIGKGVGNLLLIWTFTGWGSIMRITRSRVLSLKQEPFVESCRANGIGSLSIMFHHILPNTMGPIIVNATMNIAGYILAEAGLAYLGLGVPDSLPTWGNIINAAKRLDIVQTDPLLWIAPGVAICLVVLCVNFFGDGLRDALDPSSR
mgnify:FL=1